MLEDIVYEKLTTRGDPPSIHSTHNRESANLSEEDICFKELDHYIQEMQATRNNFAFRHIYSVRRIIGGIIVFFKRVARKLLKWYIEPICFQQTDFNNAVTPSIGRLTQLSRFSLDNCKALQSQQAAIQGKIDEFAIYREESQTIINELTAYRKESQVRIDEFAAHREESQAKIDEFTTYQKESQAKIAQLEDAQVNAQKIIMQELHTTINELREMLKLSTQRIDELESDMSCVREVNSAIFDRNNNSFFDKNSVSQSGEDCIIAYIAMVLGYQPQQVTYLDLGANHAKEMSNTYYFYQSGARGVLVEANPKLIPELHMFRSEDTILNRCVSATDGESVDFFVMNGDGISSKNRGSVDQAMESNAYLSVTDVIKIKTISVNSIFEQYFKTPPLLLNVDIEGSDQEMFVSMDFEKYRPLIIVCEAIPYKNHLVVGEKDIQLVTFLESKDYIEYAFTGINSIFLDKRVLRERGIL